MNDFNIPHLAADTAAADCLVHPVSGGRLCAPEVSERAVGRVTPLTSAAPAPSAEAPPSAPSEATSGARPGETARRAKAPGISTATVAVVAEVARALCPFEAGGTVALKIIERRTVHLPRSGTGLPRAVA
jgi:hypothetical protein